MRLTCLTSLILALTGTHAAQARVFNYKDASVAAYVRGTGGLSAVGQEAFGNSSGTDTVVDEETNFSFSGDIGVQIALGSKMNLRIGAEMIQHRPVNEAQGLNASDAERFTLDSSVFVFNPGLTVEYIYKELQNTRFYAGVGGGFADITVENRYTMTATGTSELGGVQSFTEKMQAQGTSFHIVTGLETLFVDNSTLSLDVGYRYLPVNELKYKAPVNNIVSPGGVAKDSTVYNHDGSKRTMDLGGAYVGLTFKFYMNFL